jgi:glycosyltransferase involved in cell wall biosynthesis
MTPLVSVIVATYNRSGVLRHALRSALASTRQDIEVLVVGDHCTDDTAAVVDAIADPRIRFVNLAENHGDQSGPSNHALSLATGRYVAFLNQDDLYFPDHLAAAIAHLQATGADLVWTPTLVIEPGSEDSLARGEWQVRVGGVPPAGVYDPLTFCVASSWVAERRLFDRVGPWRQASELYVSSSQDWLYRAARSGARLVFLPRPGVIAIYSGARPASYARRDSPEHDACASRLAEPGFREQLLTAAAVSQARLLSAAGHGSPMRPFARAIGAPLRAICERVGMHPLSAHLLLRLYRRGTLIARHRRHTGA